ncbi:MAG: putative DNA binding domain-containing protein [Thermomicrobiales bacterium]
MTLLDILRRAETRSADIIAITDHNTVEGYASLQRGLQNLTLLESLGRITQDEHAQLEEYRRLLSKILVLPGVEFTATFGFHILGIFPPDTSIRKLEHTLLDLNIPDAQLEEGTGVVGATTDVLNAYEILHDAGAMVIPAHVNSTHGIAMQNMPFGGQTKIAFTQSPLIHALEATDLESNSRRSTRKFFNGSKPDYPRRLHIIQGSDAHRLNRNPAREKDLGVGDRMTEVHLPEPTFEALRELFESEQFNRTRPYRPSRDPYDFIRTARSEGNTFVQSFHELPPKRRGRLSPILRDVVALANENGGTIFVGLSANPKEQVKGVQDAAQICQDVKEDAARHVTPPITITTDVGMTENRNIVIITVPAGHEKPYAVAPGNIYVRQEGETTLAMRDEIVDLVKSGLESEQSVLPLLGGETQESDGEETKPKARSTRRRPAPARNDTKPDDQEEQSEDTGVPLPRTGVEIVESTEREGVIYHSMRDLRNLKVVHNVTRDSARALWRYAITQKEQHDIKADEVSWVNGRGFWKAYKPRNASERFNLVYREGRDLRVFYGVTEDGLDSEWRRVVPNKHLDG